MEFGEATQVNPGKREKKRWKDAIDCCEQDRIDEADPQIIVQFIRNLEYIRDRKLAVVVDNPPELKHVWIWGPTGSGKSRKSRSLLKERFPSVPLYNKLQNKWWDHYRPGQPALLDDLGLEVGKMLAGYLKLWLDMYVFKVEYKGGAKDIRPPLLVITSNYHPWDMFGHDVEGLYEPIMRRVEVQFLGLTQHCLPPPKGPAVLVLPDATGPTLTNNSGNAPVASPEHVAQHVASSCLENAPIGLGQMQNVTRVQTLNLGPTPSLMTRRIVELQERILAAGSVPNATVIDLTGLGESDEEKSRG